MKKICLIGGGHGTSRLIKGFKDIDISVDIVVTSSDNGGHTGKILEEFNVPALGDLRMVLESICDEDINRFLAYRFKNLHGVDNLSLGNLMLLSLVLENNSVEKMLKDINKYVSKKYHLYLANNEYISLHGKDIYGNEIIGEVNIGETNNIKEVYFKEEGIVDTKVIESIENSDVIVLSFGSFFTSLGAVLANSKIKDAISKSNAKLVYIPNLVNQTETCDYVLEDYVDYLENTLNRKIDRVIISNSKIKRKYVKKYSKSNKKVVSSNLRRDNYEYYPLLVVEDDKLRHDVNFLGQIIVNDKMG